MQTETVGTSPKLKAALVVMLAITAPILTLLTAIFPDVFTPTASVAIASVVTALAGAFGVYKAGPGTVTGATPAEDMPNSAPLNIHADPDAPPSV